LVKFDSNDNCTDDDDKFRITPLTYAAIYGHVEVVRVLLEGGANVDTASDIGRTALHEAATFDHLDVCRLLLDWGAKVDRLDKLRYTALHWAALLGHLSVVKLLVERGADVSVESGVGYAASGLARFGMKEDVADWLDSVRRG
jgi:ankyrin repeat protein